MNINASIIDQRLTGIQKEFQQQAQNDFDTLKAGQLKSLAFVYLLGLTQTAEKINA